jgi:hypothetical protein
MMEYIGCKIDPNKTLMKLTQPVLMQSFEDEFDLSNAKSYITPGELGKTLHSVKHEVGQELVDATMQTKFHSGVGKLLHLMKWSQPKAMNGVCELSCFMTGAMTAHMKAMYHVMKCCLGMRDKGLTLKPNCKWDGDPNFEFVITGCLDSDYAKDESRQSVRGYSTFLCGAPISMKSKMQQTTTLSVTESA